MLKHSTELLNFRRTARHRLEWREYYILNNPQPTRIGHYTVSVTFLHSLPQACHPIIGMQQRTARCLIFVFNVRFDLVVVASLSIYYKLFRRLQHLRRRRCSAYEFKCD